MFGEVIAHGLIDFDLLEGGRAVVRGGFIPPVLEGVRFTLTAVLLYWHLLLKQG